MTNLEHAQEIHDEAKSWLDVQLHHPGNRKIERAVDLLGLLIQENRELRKRRDEVAATMTY